MSGKAAEGQPHSKTLTRQSMFMVPIHEENVGAAMNWKSEARIPESEFVTRCVMLCFGLRISFGIRYSDFGFEPSCPPQTKLTS